MTATDRHSLSQPDPELLGATDQELLELMPEQFREDLATVSRMAAYGAGTGVTPGLFRVSLNTGALAFARAVLARYGHQPAPPAEGEVADEARYLARELRDQADDMSPALELFGLMHRAADLLEHQAAPVPVAVSGWQPISTAPKDGTEILASDYDAIEIASWVAPRFDVGITGEWTNREGEAMYPAWWQPLADHPPLPSGEVES